MPNIGPLELAIVLLVVLIIFGPKRLPGLGRQLGTGMREFKDSITARHDADDDDDAPRRAEISRTAAQDAPAPNSARDDAPVSGS